MSALDHVRYEAEIYRPGGSIPITSPSYRYAWDLFEVTELPGSAGNRVKKADSAGGRYITREGAIEAATAEARRCYLRLQAQMKAVAERETVRLDVGAGA